MASGKAALETARRRPGYFSSWKNNEGVVGVWQMIRGGVLALRTPPQNTVLFLASRNKMTICITRRVFCRSDTPRWSHIKCAKITSEHFTGNGKNFRNILAYLKNIARREILMRKKEFYIKILHFGEQILCIIYYAYIYE